MITILNYVDIKKCVESADTKQVNDCIKEYEEKGYRVERRNKKEIWIHEPLFDRPVISIRTH